MSRSSDESESGNRAATGTATNQRDRNRDHDLQGRGWQHWQFFREGSEMKMVQFLVLVIVLILSACHSIRDPEVSIDGRFGLRCMYPHDGTKGEICMPSFYRVVAEPEKYHGRKIILTGYLVFYDEAYVLFPGRELFYMGSNIEGIELSLSSSQLEELIDLPQKGVGGYRVIGILDAKYSGGGIPRLGHIVVERLVEPSLVVEGRLLRLEEPE